MAPGTGGGDQALPPVRKPRARLLAHPSRASDEARDEEPRPAAPTLLQATSETGAERELSRCVVPAPCESGGDERTLRLGPGS